MNDLIKAPGATKAPVVIEDYADEMRQESGAGREQVRLKDVLLPRLVILQQLSPQISKTKAEFVEGAESGDWFNVATGDLFKGPIHVIPVFFKTAYIEWKPKRQGMAKNHGQNANVLLACSINEKGQSVLPNGNIVAETANWFVLINVGGFWQRAFLPLASTNLKNSRKWMTMTEVERLVDSRGPFPPPLYYRSWFLSANLTSNAQGEWFAVFATKGDNIYQLDATKELLKEAKAFCMDAKSDLVAGEMVDENDHDARSNNAKVISDKM